MQSSDPIIDYLAYFNQIDKYFDKVLKTDKFLPYNEKIKRIIDGSFPISRYLKLYKYELQFFGELRNHITHGIKLDGHNYAIPSPYALHKIKTIAKAIKDPPSCFDVFKKDVYFCKTSDHLKDILPVMKYNAYSHVPVYDSQNKFVGVLSESNICYRLAKQFERLDHNLQGFKISDIPLEHGLSHYMFVSKKTNIYQIDQIFTLKKTQKKRLWAIFITNKGKEQEPILGVITAGDVALVDTYVVH